jgi:hypothetical protein
VPGLLPAHFGRRRCDRCLHVYRTYPDNAAVLPQSLAYVCGRHPLGKNFRRSDARLGLRSCVRPLNAATTAAGPDGVRELDP